MRTPIDDFFLQSNKQTRIVLFIGVLGLLLFLVTASLFSFKNQLFSLLYPKPSATAQDATSLTITGINSSNNMANLAGYDFSWDAGSIGLTDAAYAVLFITTKDESGNIVDQHWLVGSHATEGLYFNGSYTFPVAGTAAITVWETNNVDCAGFTCNPNLAIYNSNAFVVPRITPTPTASPTQNYGTITGSVYSSAGGIVAGVKITITISGSKKIYSSNSMGSYSISNLPPAIYNLTFQNKNYFNKSISVAVSSGSTASGNVIMTKK